MSSGKHIKWESWEEVDPDYYDGYSFYRKGVDRKGKVHEDWDDGSRVRTPRAGVGVDNITRHLDDTSIADDYGDNSYRLTSRGESHNEGRLQSEELFSGSYNSRSHKETSQENFERSEPGSYRPHYADTEGQTFVPDAGEPGVAEGDFDAKKRKVNKGKDKEEPGRYQPNEFEEQREGDAYGPGYADSGYTGQEDYPQDTAGYSTTKEPYLPKKHKSKGSDRPERHRSSTKETSRSKTASHSRSDHPSKHTSRQSSNRKSKTASRSRENEGDPEETELDPFYSTPDTIHEEEGTGTHASSGYDPADVDPIATDDVSPGVEGPDYEYHNYDPGQRAGGSAYVDVEGGFNTAEMPDETGWEETSYADQGQTGHRHHRKAPPRQTEQQVPEYPDDFQEDEDEVLNALAQNEYNFPRPGPSTSTTATYDIPDDDGTATPTQMGLKGQNRIGNPVHTGNFEHLDPRYVIEHSSRFQVGEVFKVLWSEPKGSQRHTGTRGAVVASLITDMNTQNDEYGIPFYVGFRRFIVVATDEGHSTCVPILTYEKKGCKKRGVKASKHGIIHAEGRSPKMLDNEPRLGFQPVRMKLTANDEKLAKESRVNYSKLVTVEHNIKVFFIGHILSQDVGIVSDAVDSCWYNKRRGPKAR